LPQTALNVIYFCKKYKQFSDFGGSAPDPCCLRRNWKKIQFCL